LLLLTVLAKTPAGQTGVIGELLSHKIA